MASQACCKLSPVSDDYQAQGKYETIGGLKTCTVFESGNILDLMLTFSRRDWARKAYQGYH